MIHAPGFYDFALQNLFHARPARETPYFRKIEFIDRLTVLYLDFVLCAIQRSREIFPAPAKYYVFFLHSAFQILFALLIAFFAEQSEHILLVCLDAWLIEGIYAEQIAGDAAGLLEEVNEVAEVPFIRAVDLEHDIRRAAVNVREQRALICLGVDELNALARKVVQAVDIVLFLLDDALRARLAHPEHGDR